jgi:hypothetical protein
MQAGNKMQVPKKTSGYPQEKFSLRVVATQIPKPRQPNTYFLSSLFNLEDEISLRVVVCHDPGFYQILGENFRFYFACVD